MQLYAIACEVIKIASNLDSSQDFASHMSHHSARMVMFAAYCILRIFRSHLSQRLDLEHAEEHFFLAISISKKRSVQDNDLDGLNSIMLTKLWSSNNLFCRPNSNSNSLQLDVRRRLVCEIPGPCLMNVQSLTEIPPKFMSVVFDSFWWWLREFGELSDSYHDGQAGDGSRGDAHADHQEGLSSNPALPAAREVTSRMLTDDFLPSDPSFDSFDYSSWDWATAMASIDNVSIAYQPSL